jgi:hypothetical protein
MGKAYWKKRSNQQINEKKTIINKKEFFEEKGKYYG